MEDKLVKLDLGELIDRLSIFQIKEWLLDGDFSEAMSDIEHDIDRVYETTDIKLTANMIRQIVLMAQSNLHVWLLKETMKGEKDSSRYNKRLKLAQDFNNGIKNSIKNMLLAKTGEDIKPKLKATFVEPGDWFSPIIDSMGVRNNEV